ncbi:MAG: hypothetical protein ACEQSK_17120, partial [Sphingomonadaceae bacterium]
MSIRILRDVNGAFGDFAAHDIVMGLSAVQEASLVTNNEAEPVLAQIGLLTAGQAAAIAASPSSIPGAEAAVSGNAFALMIGADHAESWKWGSTDGTPAGMTPNSTGYMQVYLDRGVKPYLAINTSNDVSHAPGRTPPIWTVNADGMGWDRIRRLAAAGVEIMSHSHFHVQAWDRLNIGLFIGRVDAGVGTIQITSTQIILTGPGGVEATYTRSSYPTIADIVAAINGTASGLWQALISEGCGLTGLEKSTNLLPISGARDISPAATNGRFFCCGGGLYFSGPVMPQINGVAPVEQFLLVMNSNGYLEVFINGVRVAYLNCGGGQTFSGLVTALNAVAAISNAGITFSLCDNGKTATPSFQSYMFGDELASALTVVNRFICPPGQLIHPGVLEAGLSQRYIRDRQYQLSVDVAAANGVTLSGFAESGSSWYACHAQGHDQFKVYRGVQLNRGLNSVQASPLRLEGNTPSWSRTSFLTLNGWTSPEKLVALADAMADSPGLSAYILNHALSSPGGVNGGYNLGNLIGADQDYANFAAFLDRIKTHIASGKIATLFPSEAASIAPYAARPRNMVFNPKFRTDGSTLAGGGVNVQTWAPGWNITNAAGTSAVRDDATGYLLLTSTGAARSFGLEITVGPLQPGATYEYGLDVLDAAVISGTGVQAGMRRGQYGRFAKSRIEVGYSSTQYGGTQIITKPGTTWGRYRMRSNTQERMPLRAVGLPGPYNIVAASNDVFNVVSGQLSITLASPLTLTAGAARTAYQVAAEINAAIAADANFQGSPEMAPIAKAEKKGRANAALVLEFP